MRRLIKWLSNATLALLVLSTILLILVPALFASRLAVVYSGSMEPVMHVGSVAIMESVAPEQIRVGDIIAFNPPWDPEVTVSHRVIEIVSEPSLGFRTKGDANEDPDQEVIPAGNVLSRVVHSIPKLGVLLLAASRYSKNQIGFVLFVALPTLLLIGNAIRDMNFMVSPKKRRARQRQKLLERRKSRRFAY